jgi:stage V sporulation protein B
VALGIMAITAGLVFAGVLSGQAARIAIPVGASAAAVILTSVLAGVFLGREAFIRYNLALVAPPALSLLGIAVTIFVLDQRSPLAALTAFALGQWLALGLLMLGAVPSLKGVRFDRSLSRTMLNFGLFAGGASVISYLNYRADIVVVQYFEGEAGVGVYSNAVLIGESVWQVSGSLALATYARVAILDREDAIALTTRVMRHTLVLLGVVCLVLFVFADLLLMVLRPEFAAGASALRILLPGTLIYGLAPAFSGFYTYQRGMPWASALVAGVGLVLNMALSIVLVPPMGVNGAALASAIGYTIAIAGALVYFMWDAKVGPSTIFRFGRADVDDYRSLIARVRAVVRG